MSKSAQKNIALDTNDSDEGKVPNAPPPSPFDYMMGTLANAGSARGVAVDAVCRFLSDRRFDSDHAADFDALNGALKVSKLTKLAKIVSSVLNVIKIGGQVETPILNPIDYK